MTGAGDGGDDDGDDETARSYERRARGRAGSSSQGEQTRTRVTGLQVLLHKHARRENAWYVPSMWLQYAAM